jgi:hypothetical protein
MIAKGKIGSEGVLFDTLWANLPEPHQEAMQAGLEALRQRGFFQETKTGDGSAMVSLNPQMLLEAQNLINRDITDFWATIVSPEISQNLQDN